MPPNDTLTADTVFALLSNPRRRFIIAYLQAQDQPVETTELARQIASLENDVPVEAVTDKQEKRVHVSLYQTHVPKLADSGVLSYDTDRGEVSLAAGVREVEQYVPAPDSDQPPWRYAYALAAGVGLVFYLATLGGVWMFAQVSVAATSSVIVAGFVLIAALQLYLGRLHETPQPVRFLDPRRGEPADEA
jgi:hypothetical protein